MTICTLCRDLEKEEQSVRLAFDFTPSQLLWSIGVRACQTCATILEALMQYGNGSLALESDVRRVYAISDVDENITLRLEVYFYDSRPRAELEIFTLGDTGTSRIQHSCIGRATCRSDVHR